MSTLVNSRPIIRRKRPLKEDRMLALLKHPERILEERCKRSFFTFMQEFWDQISPEEPKWNWHIPYLCSELEKIAYRVAEGLPKEHDLIINIPPGTTKSTTATIMFPVWCWIRWPWMKFIATSYTSPLSLEHAEASRDLVRSEKFQATFPYLQIKQDKDQKSNFQIMQRLPDGSWVKAGSRFSTSVGGSVTGFHGHILIVDDPIDPKKSISPVAIETANKFISQTLSTRKIDKAVVPMILIMQRLHQNDPTGFLLAKKSKRIKHICLPGEITHFPEKVNPPELADRYVEGLLDPMRMNQMVLEGMEEELGQYGYAGQVGQNPVPPGGGMFKTDFLTIVDTLPAEVNFVSVLRYWDKAGTQDGGCATAGVKMAKMISRTGHWYLVMDVKKGHWSAEVREAIMLATAEADGTRVRVGVEQEPGSGGKESAESTIRNLSGFTVFADRPTGDKIFRADPFSVQVNNGNVKLLRGSWNEAFIEELKFFPMGTYKDQVDAASAAFNKLAGKREAKMLDAYAKTR